MESDDYIEDHDDDIPDFRDPEEIEAAELSHALGSLHLFGDDPFLRMWFRVVAPNRAALVAGSAASRGVLLAEHWSALLGQAWEELCRRCVVSIRKGALA